MPKKKNYKAFTLIEVLISVAIIVTISVASIPFFKGMSEKQVLRQNAGKFYNDISLTQTKSRTGVTDDNYNKVWWAVEMCSKDSSGNSQSNTYSLGPVVVTSNSGSLSVDWNYFDNNKVQRSMAENVKFDSTTVCNTNYSTILFERLSGNSYDRNLSKLDSVNIKLCLVKDTTKECSPSDRNLTIYVNKVGSVIIKSMN